MHNRRSMPCVAPCRCWFLFCGLAVVLLAFTSSSMAQEAADAESANPRMQPDQRRQQAEERHRQLLEQRERALQLETLNHQLDALNGRQLERLNEQLELLNGGQLVQLSDQLRQLILLHEHAMRQTAESKTVDEPSANAELPDDAKLLTFRLKHIKPTEAARVLSEVFGDASMRIGVDEPRNMLLLQTDERTFKSVRALIQEIDTMPAAESPREHEAGPLTLQVRIVWLLDGLPEGEGRSPTAGAVGPEVVDALKVLGFENPKVVSQQSTTFTASSSREGNFSFKVPVLIRQQSWQLTGRGMLTTTDVDQFNVRFLLGVSRRQGDGALEQSQLEGTTALPLRHYAVMGTTSFVSRTHDVEETPQQHLSAFVIYLDRAREFPANAAVDRQDDAFAF